VHVKLINVVNNLKDKNKNGMLFLFRKEHPVKSYLDIFLGGIIFLVLCALIELLWRIFEL